MHSFGDTILDKVKMPGILRDYKDFFRFLNYSPSVIENADQALVSSIIFYHPTYVSIMLKLLDKTSRTWEESNHKNYS